MTRDFTLEKYVELLDAMKDYNVVSVEKFLRGVAEPFLVLRHDVDAFPDRAARMARLEHQLGVHGTYYFRWDPKLPGLDGGKTAADVGGFSAHNVIECKLYGHEVGYHYENLAHLQTKEKALDDFEAKLTELRKYAPVQTIAMHRPPKTTTPSSEMFTTEDLDAYQLLGEIYKSTAFSNVAYLSDKGRIWRPGRQVGDNLGAELSARVGDTDGLIELIQAKTHPRLMLKVHPHKWNHGAFEWVLDRAMMR